MIHDCDLSRIYKNDEEWLVIVEMMMIMIDLLRIGGPCSEKHLLSVVSKNRETIIFLCNQVQCFSVKQQRNKNARGPQQDWDQISFTLQLMQRNLSLTGPSTTSKAWQPL